MLKVPLKIFQNRNSKFGQRSSINEQPDTYPESVRALALTVLVGEATRRKKKKNQCSNIRTGPLYYSIVGTVKI